MATRQQEPYGSPETNAALASVVFAASMMVLIGAFQAIAGLVAIFGDADYVVTPNDTFDLDVTAWGWIQPILDAVIFAGGVASSGAGRGPGISPSASPS